MILQNYKDCYPINAHAQLPTKGVTMTHVIQTEAEKLLGYMNPQLYCHTRRVASIIIECARTDPADFDCGKPWIIDQRDQNPILTPNHSIAGLFLSFVQKCPYSLWTPWGQWYFCAADTDNFDPVLPELFSRLDTEKYSGVRTERGVEFGPVYSVLAVDGVELPIPAVYDYLMPIQTDLITEHWERFTSLWQIGRL